MASSVTLYTFLPAAIGAIATLFIGSYVLWYQKACQEELREIDFLFLLTELEQNSEATEQDLEMLKRFAHRERASTHAQHAMALILLMHGEPVRRGHVWWVMQQISGRLPKDAIAPACVAGAGLRQCAPAAKVLF